MNRYTKLIKSLKEDAPTNSMSGVYSDNAPGFRVGPKDKAKKFYPDVDGNFTDGIPGEEGDPFYLRPEGYWDGGNDWTEDQVPDASQDYLAEDPTGKSTNDLISEDGTVKTFLPPNSRSFILGPLVDGYVPNHGYDNYTNIGYIQKDTRQFVLLARIQGQFTADLHSAGARVWDGTAEQLTIYNSNFTLEMAEWFRDQITAGTSTSNVPYFYSGGVPQQELSVLQCPSCPPNMFGGVTPGTRTGGGFGTGTPPSLGSQQQPPQSGDQVRIKYFNLTPDQVRTLAALLAIGLSVAAVIAILFPEPASSAAGAGYLASKFRFAAGLKRSLANLWKAKPKTYKKIEYPKPQPPKPKEIRFDPTKPGGGQEWQNAARNWQRQNPGKYNPYRTDSANQLMKKYDVGKDIMNSYDHITDVGQKLMLEAALLNEVAPTGSGAGGGNDLADVYVDKASQEYDADQLQQASDDANDLAGDQGLTEKQKSDIDREAERRARELNNVDHSRPENMTRDQIDNFYDMALSVDPEWLEQHFYKYESLIDKNASDKAYEDYDKQRDYLGSEEYYGTFAGYNQYKNESDYWWPYVTGHTETRYNKIYDGGKLVGWATAVYKNGVRVSNEAAKAYFKARSKWYTAYKEYYRIFYDVVLPARKTALEKASDTYSSAVSKAFRAFDMALIKAWGQRNVNDDPYSLEDLFPNADLSNMSEAEKKRLLKLMQKLGVDYGEVAALPALALPIIAAPAFKTALAGGMIALTAYLQQKGVGPQLINQIADTMGGYDAKDLDPTGEVGVKDDYGDSVPDKRMPPLSDKENMADRHAKEKADADKALQDAIDQHGADSDEAVEARQRRNDVYTRHKREKKSVKESYKPKFRRNRETLTEIRTPRQKRLLREIKQPVKVKDAPTKYKMNFSGKYSPQNTPDKTASSESDALVASGNEKGRKWREEDKRWSGYETTERMNIIHDRVGHGSQYWDRMLDEAKSKNGWRTREVQEELNKIAHEKAMLKENPDFKSPFGGGVEVEDTTTKNVQNFERVTKIKKVVADTKPFNNKEIKPEYPDDESKEKDRMLKMIDQMGPEMEKEYEGDKAKTGENAAARYKRLDPISAKSMPDAGYPQIDALRDQAKKKPK